MPCGACSPSPRASSGCWVTCAGSTCSSWPAAPPTSRRGSPARGPARWRSTCPASSWPPPAGCNDGSDRCSRWCSATASGCRWPTACVDLVVSEHGAAAWCDPERWLPEAARLLRPGGRLVFLTNSHLSALCVPPDEGVAGERLLRGYARGVPGAVARWRRGVPPVARRLGAAAARGPGSSSRRCTSSSRRPTAPTTPSTRSSRRTGRAAGRPRSSGWRAAPDPAPRHPLPRCPPRKRREDPQCLDRPMRIFFTGGSGKAGRHVAPHLAEQGHHVTNADLVPLGHPDVADLRVDLTDAGETYSALAGLATVRRAGPGREARLRRCRALRGRAARSCSPPTQRPTRRTCSVPTTSSRPRPGWASARSCSPPRRRPTGSASPRASGGRSTCRWTRSTRRSPRTPTRCRRWPTR